MCTIQIKDGLTLRQFAISQATAALGFIVGFNKESYDINNHLAIAKAIENYVKGDVELSDKEGDKTTELYDKLMSMCKLSGPRENKTAANFEVK